jgi:HAD superfamily hydrolase (TIGR01509 family)
MISAIAWDIDGTLIDSEPTHQAALAEVSARYGVEISPEDRRFTGVALEGVWTMLAPRYPAGLDRQAWVEAIVSTYVAMAPALRPFPRARETVEALARKGHLQGCVSNSGRRIVDANLAALGFANLFRFSIAREDVEFGKPDPEPYRLACRRFDLAPEAVLAVEDSGVGAASARAAGLPVVRIDQHSWRYQAVLEAARL